MHRSSLHNRSRPIRDWPVWAQYALSLGAVAAALALRLPLNPVLHDRVPFITLFAVMLPLVLLVRPGPFLAAALLGLSGVVLIFPLRFQQWDSVASALELLLFGFVALAATGAAWLSQRAQRRTRSADAMLRAFVDDSPTCKWITGADGRIIYANRAIADAIGMPVEKILGRTHAQILPPRLAQLALDHIRSVRESGQPCMSFEEIEPLGTNQSRRMLEWRRFLLRVDDDHVLVAGMANDVTEKIRLEAALRDSEQRYRSLASIVTDVPWTTDAEGQFVTPQDAYARYTGKSWEDLRGSGWVQCVHPDDRAQLTRIWQHAVATRSNYRAPCREWHGLTQSWRHVIARGTPVFNADGSVREWVGSLTDVHEQKLAEDALRKSEGELRSHRDNLQHLIEQRTAELKESAARMVVAERLAAVGTLAAGLAHDMNNLLMPLASRLEFLRSGQPLRPGRPAPLIPDEVREELLVLSALLDLLRSLSKNLSLFARDPEQDGVEGRTNLAKWQEQVSKLIDASVGRAILLKWDCPATLPEAAIAPHRLTQAVQNLIHNGRDAILAKFPPESRDPAGREMGRITVEARAALDDATIILTVADNGCGMSEAVRERCLEAFYTTKDRPSAPGTSSGATSRATSGGSGLGLSLAHQIIERAGGTMTLDSALGVGTTITLRLPIAVPAAVPAKKQVR